MSSIELEQAFNESEMVLCRSGYTTVMDLVKLRKKAFFIPTPGQYEQEYLAEKYKAEGLAPYAIQDDFTMENIKEIDNYRGLPQIDSEINWKCLFQVFETE